MNTQVPLWVPLLSVLVAFLSACVSAIAIFVTRDNFKRQLTVHHEMMERQFLEQRENLEKQMKIQLTTTIDKEWIGHLRTAVIDFLESVWIFVKFRVENKEVPTNELQSMIDKFYLSKETCSTLLDSENLLQKELMMMINDIFSKLINPKDVTVNVDRHREEMISLLHKIILSKRYL